MGSVLSIWRRAPAEHVCVWDRTCAPAAHVVIEVFPSWSGFSSHVTSPTCRIPHSCETQIKRSSLNETQMWNASAELRLRQPPLRGFLFPESHNTRKTVSIAPRAGRSAPGRFGRKTRARFQCLLVRIGSYWRAGGPGEGIKTPKGISLFDQGGFKTKENSCKASRCR